MFNRRRKSAEPGQLDLSDSSDNNIEKDVLGGTTPTKSQLHRATRSRLIWAYIASFLLLVSVVFTILVEVGDTAVNPVRNAIYFIKLDLSNIIPVSVPDAVLINSIAQTLGLHDFYTVGLWNYCEGYNGQGTTQCSPSQTMYWFNPVEILKSQLLDGATIALPAEVTQILYLIKYVSNVMFVLFLVSACLSTVLIPLLPLVVRSRWVSFPFTVLTFLTAACVLVAAVIATVLFIIMQMAVTSVTELNIKASIGVEMFVFMWIAAGSAVLAWLIIFGGCCCCASRRDVRTGRRWGSKKAWRSGKREKAVEEDEGMAGALAEDRAVRQETV